MGGKKKGGGAKKKEGDEEDLSVENFMKAYKKKWAWQHAQMSFSRQPAMLWFKQAL